MPDHRVSTCQDRWFGALSEAPAAPPWLRKHHYLCGMVGGWGRNVTLLSYATQAARSI